jgi:hypothetical protein
VDLKGPCTRYGVDFAIADDLAFETASDGLRGATVEVMLIAYDRDGNPLNSVVRRRELGLKPQSFAAAQAAGLQLHFDIDVPTDTLAKNNAYSVSESTMRGRAMRAHSKFRCTPSLPPRLRRSKSHAGQGHADSDAEREAFRFTDWRCAGL